MQRTLQQASVPCVRRGNCQMPLTHRVVRVGAEHTPNVGPAHHESRGSDENSPLEALQSKTEIPQKHTRSHG